jgi:rhodanese-related sulfurtransferase
MIKKSSLICAVISLMAGCGNIEKQPENNLSESKSSAKSPYRKISAQEAYAMMNELTEYVLLDVRTAEEFMQTRIAGAILIPVQEIRNRAAAGLPDKNAVILVYCRSGNRSANAAMELIAMGYKNVYDFGGIADWPYDTIK